MNSLKTVAAAGLIASTLALAPTGADAQTAGSAAGSSFDAYRVVAITALMADHIIALVGDIQRHRDRAGDRVAVDICLCRRGNPGGFVEHFDLDRAVRDFSYFEREEPKDEFRVRAREDELWASIGCFYL